jgi:hypothetical protein
MTSPIKQPIKEEVRVSNPCIKPVIVSQPKVIEDVKILKRLSTQDNMKRQSIQVHEPVMQPIAEIKTASLHFDNPDEDEIFNQFLRNNKQSLHGNSRQNTEREKTRSLKQNSMTELKLTVKKEAVVLPPYINTKTSMNKSREDAKLKEQPVDLFDNIPTLKPLSKINTRILSARLPKDKGFINKLRPNTASMNRIENKIIKNNPTRPVTAMNRKPFGGGNNNNVINININFYNFDEQVKPTPVKDLLYVNTNVTKTDDFFKDIKDRPQTGKFRSSLMSAIKSNGFVFKEIIKALDIDKETKKLTINDLTQI